MQVILLSPGRKVIDNPVHNGNLRDEGDDLHPSPALRADHRVHLIDLPDHGRASQSSMRLPNQGRPAFGRKAPELLLDDPEWRRTLARLPNLPPMGVRVEPVVTDHDLAFVGNMRGHPGDKLQIIHRLRRGPLLARPVKKRGTRLSRSSLPCPT